MPYELELPLVPTSYNETRYAPWYVVRRKNEALVNALTLIVRTSDLPKPCPAIVARADLRFSTRRRRDEGNFRTPLEKALGDVLVKEGVLEDDTPDRFRFEQLVFVRELGPPLTRLWLDVEQSD